LRDEKIELEKKTRKEIMQLSEINNTQKAIIEEYKEKTDSLKSLVTEYEPHKKVVVS